jgi:NTE family protein
MTPPCQFERDGGSERPPNERWTDAVPGDDDGDVHGIALVLGAGGVAGGAWHAGALAALAEATGWDPRRASVVVGTSAGSITGAALRSGLDAEDQWRLAVGRELSPAGARLFGRITTSPVGLGRVRPRRAPANPNLVRAMLSLDPRPGVALAGLLPEGSLSAAGIANRVDELAGGTWPADPLWVVAVDLARGTRTVFGRDGAPRSRLGQAVAASCAVPAFFAPVTIDGHRYVDGRNPDPRRARGARRGGRPGAGGPRRAAGGRRVRPRPAQPPRW